MSDSTDARLRASTTAIAQGEKDQIVERHVAEVNGHDLAKCKGWEGPLTPEERRLGKSAWYKFFACERCGREAVASPARWENVECDPEGGSQ
jgi:hypothetical protein